MKITAPGIYRDVPMADYLADPCPAPSLSSGLAHTLITSSPLHAWTDHVRLNPHHRNEEDTKFDIGTAGHEALLQGLDRCVVVDAPDWRTKAAKEQRDAARARGFIPLLDKHYGALNDMVNTARTFIETTELAGLFSDGAAEQTMVWQEGPLWFRARPDWLSADRSIVLHYKTCGGSVHPQAFIRNQLGPMGYDMALAFYERGIYALPGAGADAPTSVILAQETSPPYCCSLIGLNPEMAELANTKVTRAVRLWGECMARNRWPAYPPQIHYAEPTPWQRAEEAEQAYRALEIDPVQQREGLQA